MLYSYVVLQPIYVIYPSVFGMLSSIKCYITCLLHSTRQLFRVFSAPSSDDHIPFCHVTVLSYSKPISSSCAKFKLCDSNHRVFRRPSKWFKSNFKTITTPKGSQAKRSQSPFFLASKHSNGDMLFWCQDYLGHPPQPMIAQDISLEFAGFFPLKKSGKMRGKFTI